MGVTYDTDDIRRSARQLASAADEMSEIAGQLSRIRSAVPGSLQGDAGQELERLLTNLNQDSSRMSSGIRTMAAKLRSFAAFLDDLDRRMTAAINEKS